MNATRAATIRGRAWVGGVVSLGRVQTPTLALMVKREREIQAFVPEPYWLVHAQFDPRYEGLWFEGDETRLKEAERAEEIVDQGLRQGRHGRVGRAQGAVRARAAPLRPDLAPARRQPPLRLLGAPHAAGRAVAVRGQEGAHLPANQLALPVRRPGPAAEADGRDAPADRRVRRSRALRPRARSSCRSRAWSTTRRSTTTTRSSPPTSSTTSAASRPTSAASSTWSPGASSPSSTRRRATSARRSSRWSRRSASARAARSRSRPAGAASTGYSEADAGRARQDEEGENESAELPPLEQGQTVRCVEAEVEAKETKPPPRYTEATLLSAMETAGKLIDDEELREAMKESGLGTPATRAETIETLIRREYIERVGKDLHADPEGPAGDHDARRAPAHLARAHRRLGEAPRRHRARRGRPRRSSWSDIAEFTRETVEQIAALDKEKLRPERVELGPCPRCGAETGEIIRENSRAYGCTSWKSREEPGCGFVIWKRVAGRTLTPEVARQLLEEGKTQGGPLRLPLTCRQTFSRAPRLERGGEGRVRLSRSRANRRRPLSRNSESTNRVGSGRADREGRFPLATEEIVLQCERQSGQYVD